MQTERVTFLTTAEHKAALDAFARGSGMSVGHVVREATSRYMAEGDVSEEEELSLLVDELNVAVPKMIEDIDAAISAINEANAHVDAVLAGEER
ncbi:hypothetical protein [Sphingomonas corticis]|jgi:KaiC/GvpD/RAD55 family RecA-like ATPase|uniref:Ribbon-helix-helix protein, CopG family n=1 Tax=Sphingomonas corticis TaxID=2722791 RepID=A0ABX1CJC6_9SPHN|nr:hypothetical protein [Sphingomonas corticis]NJR78089.1 hypothetical protein [Sphingomonas corticis]